MGKRKAQNSMIAHEDFPGLYCRDGYWYVRYKVRKRQVKRSFGNGRDSRKRAIHHLATINRIRDEKEGYIPLTAKEKPMTGNDMRANPLAHDKVTLGELCDDWMRHVRSNPQSYKDQTNPPYRAGLVKEQFGQRIAASLRPYEIRDWLDTFTKWAPSTKNKLKATVSAVYRYGRERDKVQVNPARDVKRDKVSNGVVRFLKPDEEKRLRAVLHADIDAAEDRPQYKKRMQHRIYELEVSLKTGMRKGEQYGLRWPDVDFESRLIILRDTKNGDTRYVPMIDDVYKALKAVKALDLARKDRAENKPNEAPEDVVFAIGDNKKWWKSALKGAKITNYRWHDNRHTFCSRLAQAGKSLKVIQEAAGHKTIQMSARYAHLHQTHLAEAMAVLNG